MELRHLRYFSALAEQLSFTGAANQVHVTQSTLSHQIKQLEDELGHKLFNRIGKRVTLTEVGQIFLEHVHSALGAVDEGVWALQKTEDVLTTGALRIGTTPTFNLHIIPTCVALFMEQRQEIFVSVAEMSAINMYDSLLAHELDVGVAYRPEKDIGLHFEPICNEEMTLAVGEHHTLARRRFVRMVELHKRRLVMLPRTFATRVMLEHCFEVAEIRPIVVAEMNAIGPMLEIVRKTEIAAIVPRHAAFSEGIRSVPIENPTPIRTPGLLWATDRPRSLATRRICTIIQSTVNLGSKRNTALPQH